MSIGAGSLFRVEAVVALVILVLVLVRGTRTSHAAAFLIAGPAHHGGHKL